MLSFAEGLSVSCKLLPIALCIATVDRAGQGDSELGAFFADSTCRSLPFSIFFLLSLLPRVCTFASLLLGNQQCELSTARLEEVVARL